MSETIQIPRRFTGPPHSVNGGYACGVTAIALTDGPAQVTLHRPPPLERPLLLAVDADHAELRDGADLIAQARHAKLELEPPAPVTPAEAAAAEQRFDIAAYRAANDFTTCFTCGPDREPGDGLRIFPAPLDRDQAIVAWPWEAPTLRQGDDAVDPRLLWAALDCPGGWAWMAGERRGTLMVLGTMAAEIYRSPAVGEPTVVAGWALDQDRRKHRSGSALWSADGELMALAETTWIALSPEQRDKFASG